jgi:hypothetical protein
MEAINKILRYLKKTPEKELLINNNNNNNNKICGYSDADWAGSFDRKFITGYYTFVGRNIVTWKSKKQNIVASSSVEVEYQAMASTTSELMWIKQLLTDLNITTHLPIKIYSCINHKPTRRRSK